MIFEVSLRMFHSFKEQRAGFPVGEFRGLRSCGGAVDGVSEEICVRENVLPESSAGISPHVICIASWSYTESSDLAYASSWVG